MRLRSVLGAGAVGVAVVVAVVLLRAHPAPPGPNAAPVPTTAPPVVDGRARQLTAAFLHQAPLPVNFRFSTTAGQGFRFERYDDPEPGLGSSRYTATGVLVRVDHKAVLDNVAVTIAKVDVSDRTLDFASCDPRGGHDGSSCTQRAFPDGTRAKVVRNAAFAQSVASDVTTGARPGIQTQLDAVYANGTLLVVTLDAANGAGIPLDDADMLRLVSIPGVATSR
ncbi:MAG TPA: hypothetical protein VHV49_16750 [Pseudonocardiaceae bacterium]|nr:hypothetical protein [Pseudonocardiaceae bacterium]